MPSEETPRNSLTNFARKALYLGVGLAGVAADNAAKLVGRAGGQIGDLQKQLQDVVEELVQRGAMTTEEARATLENTMKRSAQAAQEQTAGPVKIEIDDLDDEVAGDPSAAIELSEASRLRQQIDALQAELDRLKGKKASF